MYCESVALGEMEGWRDGGEEKQICGSTHDEQSLTRLKHYGRHELLNTQYVYIIRQGRLLAESGTELTLNH